MEKIFSSGKAQEIFAGCASLEIVEDNLERPVLLFYKNKKIFPAKKTILALRAAEKEKATAGKTSRCGHFTA